MIHVTDNAMTSDIGSHTARRVDGRVEQWVVSWLPRRLLDRDQTLTAMLLADVYCGDPVPGSAWWLVAQDYERELGVSRARQRILGEDTPERGDR